MFVWLHLVLVAAGGFLHHVGSFMAVHRLSSLCCMDSVGTVRGLVAPRHVVLQSGVEPTSAALQGRFLTIGLPGKPWLQHS